MSREKMLRLLLPPSVCLSGAVVMVLEILGTRLIGPVYGTSLYVWSALIAVTLPAWLLPPGLALNRSRSRVRMAPENIRT